MKFERPQTQIFQLFFQVPKTFNLKILMFYDQCKGKRFNSRGNQGEEDPSSIVWMMRWFHDFPWTDFSPVATVSL